MQNFIAECRRRRVFRVAALYIVGAWIVLQVADLAFDSWGVPAEALRYIWIGCLLGFPIALIFGWRFDVIGGRILRTRSVDGDTDLSLQKADYVILVIFGVFAVAISFQLMTEISGTQSSAQDRYQSADINPRSIAVLPFDDMSENADQEYFGDGIADELLNRLAKVKDFQVAGRTSSFAFRDRPDDLRTIGDKLNVAVVLQGSVRKAGDQIRITAQLINVSDGFQLWSETFDREMDNIFAIQDEIAGSVVIALQSTLHSESASADLAPAAVTASESYVLYLKGRYQLYKRSAESARLAQELFEQAIAVDPDYAPAFAGLATSLVLGDLDDSIRIPRVNAALSRALALDPDSSEALATMGLLRQEQGRLEESRQALEQSIARNPNNAQAHTWLGRSYNYEDPTKYLIHVQRAYVSDPLDPTTLFHLSKASSRFGRYEEALAAALERHSLNPNDPMGYRLAGDAHHESGHLDKALKSYYRGYLTAQDYGISPIPRELIEMGEIELAATWIQAFKDSRPGWSPPAEAIIALLQGRREKAFQSWSEPAASDTDLGWGHIVFSGDFNSAREAYGRALIPPGQVVAHFDKENWPMFVDYALALQRTGEPQRAAELIRQTTALVEMQIETGAVWSPYGELGLREILAALYAMSGNGKKALMELQSAAESANVLSCIWCLRYWPHWDNLRGNPDFEALLANQEEKRSIQRQGLADEGLLLTPEQLLNLDDFDYDPFAD
jgi:TolB-like protein